MATVELTPEEFAKADEFQYSRKTIIHNDAEFEFYHSYKGAINYALRTCIEEFHEAHRSAYEEFATLPNSNYPRPKTIIYAEFLSEGIIPICADNTPEDIARMRAISISCIADVYTDNDLAESLLWSLRADMLEVINSLMSQWSHALDALDYTVWMANCIDRDGSHLMSNSSRKLTIDEVTAWMLSDDFSKIIDHCLRGVQFVYPTNVVDLYHTYYKFY